MKRILIYILILIILFFLIPLLFTAKFERVSVSLNQTDSIIVNSDTSYDYGKYDIIKLYHKKTGKKESIKLDDYICNVVAAEIPVDYELEAIKAQAIVARTYTIYKIKNGSKHKKDGADICDDSSCCQAWISKKDRYSYWKGNKSTKWNKIVKAVNDTKGFIITYRDKPINAFFHSNSGGYTESPKYVWGGEGYPYLKSVETMGEEEYDEYSSCIELKKEDFVKKIKSKYKDFKIDFKEKDAIKIKSYTKGKRVQNIKIGNKNFTGVEIRQIFSLKSARFSIALKKDKIKFDVIGYGHGVGMSQTGSNSLAKQGKSSDQIIKHFYTGVEVKKIKY